jgi:hypothetical protein
MIPSDGCDAENGAERCQVADDPQILYADGFAEALVGYVERCGQPVIPAYDVEKCLKILQERDGMSWEEASEFFDFNVRGSWMGPRTPAWFTPLAKERA